MSSSWFEHPSEPIFPFCLSLPMIDETDPVWNAYWEAVLKDDNCKQSYLRFMPGQHLLLRRLKVMRYQNRLDLLFVGNGISVLPFLCEYAGFNVDVIDISKIAIDFCCNNLPDESYYLSFFGGDPSFFLSKYKHSYDDESIKRMRCMTLTWKDQGRISFIAESIFQYDTNKRYDGIFLINFIDCMTLEMAAVCLSKVKELLSEQGDLIIDGFAVESLYSSATSIDILAKFFSLFDQRQMLLVERDHLINTRLHSLSLLKRLQHKNTFERLRQKSPALNKSKVYLSL